MLSVCVASRRAADRVERETYGKRHTVVCDAEVYNASGVFVIGTYCERKERVSK